jgi:hypothetical protein
MDISKWIFYWNIEVFRIVAIPNKGNFLILDKNYT